MRNFYFTKVYYNLNFVFTKSLFSSYMKIDISIDSKWNDRLNSTNF